MSPKRKATISFHRLFKKPTHESILDILQPSKQILKKKLRNKPITTSSDQFLVSLLPHFSDLPEPSDEADWLVNYNEHAQTCENFVKDTPVIDKKDLGYQRFIYYIRLGKFDNTRLQFDQLVEYARCFFNSECVKLVPDAIELDLNVKSQTMELVAKYGEFSIRLKNRFHKENHSLQINTLSIHNMLKRIKPRDAYCLIAFTEFDLFVDPEDLFVAGLCNGDLRVGVFSCWRYQPGLTYSSEFWHETKRPKKLPKNSQSMLLSRSCKLLVHETCHLLGIDHCVFMNCCMNGSGHLQEDFKQSMFLCPVDLKKLTLILEFSLKDRYEQMKKFFDKHGFVDESLWLDKVIKCLSV